MINKLNLACALAALVFFFVPWLGIEWQGEVQATQTGVQMMMGTGSSVHQPAQGAGGNWGYSYLAGLAFVAVLASFLFSFAGLLARKDDHVAAAGLPCVLAFVLLVAQGIIDFPVKEQILEARIKNAGGLAARADDGALSEMIGVLKKQAAEGLSVRSLPWFGFELAALALPILMLAILYYRSSASVPLPSPRLWRKLQPDER